MMYLTMPFLAVATATLAQDRLLTSNVVPKPMTPVELCGGAVLQTQDQTHLKCKFASKPGFENFEQDWVQSDYWVPNKWFRDLQSDEIDTPSAGWKECQDVCVAPHEAWTSSKTTCSLTVNWQELKTAAKNDLKVDLEVDQKLGLVGDKDKNKKAAMAVWELMKAQFGLTGSNEEIGKKIESQAWGMTDEKLGEKAREHMLTAMKNNKEMAEWVKKNGVAFVSYVLDQDDKWLSDTLGLDASNKKRKIPQNIKNKIVDGIERAKKTIDNTMGPGRGFFVKKKLNEIKEVIEDGKLTNKFIIDLIHDIQDYDESIEGLVVGYMC